uniref:DUF6788 domain-containing protein n=1 Tax=uncultured Armatimonadetes bacterium TaxID=157466 RepID=A0A6J4K4M3_9BACT|nr:hypothetical protein AVDCRST_MAG63-4795 [uncultured Armatimonadetes bacterium]
MSEPGQVRLNAPAAESGGGTEITPMKGVICAQFVRCGNRKCRCHQGEPHGPYYYRVWREAGQVHKEYVKPSDVEGVRAGCDVHKEFTQQLRDLRKDREQLTRRIQSEWRKVTRSRKVRLDPH